MSLLLLKLMTFKIYITRPVGGTLPAFMNGRSFAGMREGEFFFLCLGDWELKQRSPIGPLNMTYFL